MDMKHGGQGAVAVVGGANIPGIDVNGHLTRLGSLGCEQNCRQISPDIIEVFVR